MAGERHNDQLDTRIGQQIIIAGVGHAVKAVNRLIAPPFIGIDNCGHLELVGQRFKQVGVDIPATAPQAGNADPNGLVYSHYVFLDC